MKRRATASQATGSEACLQRARARAERLRTGKLTKADVGNLIARWQASNPDRPPPTLPRISIQEGELC